MAPFDIIDTVGLGYQKVWTEKQFLARSAFIPFVAKTMLISATLLFGLDQEFTIQALIMLPAFLAEGWLMTVVCRLVFFDTRDNSGMLSRGSPAMAGIVMYALIKYLQTGAMTFIYQDSPPDPAPAEASMESFALAFFAFAFVLWAFRYLWVYVPLSAGIPLRTVFRLLQGPLLSFYMIGVWLLCLVPFLLLMAFVTGMILEPYENVDQITGGIQFVLAAIQAAIDMATSVVATACMAYAFRYMLKTRSESA